jgi:hypothetical protein
MASGRDIIGYDKVAGSSGKEVAPGEYKNIYYLLQTNCNFQMIMCSNLFMILNIKHLLLDFVVLLDKGGA